jgi:hypothetical protein
MTEPASEETAVSRLAALGLELPELTREACLEVQAIARH